MAILIRHHLARSGCCWQVISGVSSDCGISVFHWTNLDTDFPDLVPTVMDNLRNLFGHMTALTSSKSSAPMGPNNASGGAGSQNPTMNPIERQRSISGDFSSPETHQNRAMKQFKTADRDSYYYIMWRS